MYANVHLPTKSCLKYHVALTTTCMVIVRKLVALNAELSHRLHLRVHGLNDSDRGVDKLTL